MKKSKLMALPLASLFMFAAPSTAFADDVSNLSASVNYRMVEVKESEVVEEVDHITINGVTYGKEHGLQRHTVTYNLVKEPISKYETRDYVPYHNYKWTRGNSYVRNQEIGYLHYRGTAYASGTTDSTGKRVISASITYKRGNAVLKKAQSNATFRNNRWVAGGVKTVTVVDSINPKAPKTKVFYNFYTVNRNLVG